MGRLHNLQKRHRSGLHHPPGCIVMIPMTNPVFTDAVDAVSERTNQESGEVRHPHITLFGPFALAPSFDEENVLHAVESAMPGSGNPSFSVTGLLRLRGRKGIAIAWNVTAGQPLKDLHRAIAYSLAPLARRLSWIDRNPAMRQFHITLRFNLSSEEADLLWSSLHEPADCVLSGRHAGLSGENIWQVDTISIIRNGTAWREYDLSGKTWLDRAGIFRKALMTRKDPKQSSQS